LGVGDQEKVLQLGGKKKKGTNSKSKVFRWSGVKSPGKSKIKGLQMIAANRASGGGGLAGPHI